MSHEQLAGELFRLFVGRNPDSKEKNDLVSLGFGYAGYLWHDLDNGISKPILLMYTSCHAEQFLSYLRQHRPDVLDKYHCVILFTHRLLLHRGFFSLEFVHGVFKHADLVITNPMNPKFEELSTIPLLPLCKPDCKIATFVPPSVSSFWPVVEVFGEEPIAKAILAGLTCEQTIGQFMTGKLDCLFDYRYQSQMERLKLREKDCDVAISGFIDNHLKTHKMFFTSNHPTFHLAAYIVEQLLHKLNLSMARGADWALSMPVNGAGFSNHHPETDYEWRHYGFTYPQRWEKEWGGAAKFYPEVIRKAYQTIKVPEQVLNVPVTPVELEP